jgi:predicted outer membrane repeat protein
MKTNSIPTPFIFLFASLFTFALPATATIRYVKVGGTGDGLTWASASGVLQSMIDASTNGDEVWVAAGIHRILKDQPVSMKLGVKIYGGFDGNETSLTQRNFSQNITSLRPYDMEAIIVNIDNGLDNTAQLDGFTIEFARQTAVININSSPTFINCTFYNNVTSEKGGGMYLNNATPAITNCSFKNNSANSRGGGIYSINSRPFITNCTFLSNGATTGGGIANENGKITITGCTFTINGGTLGGAIYSTGAAATITHSVFKGNQTVNGGGAIYLYDESSGSPTSYVNCLFSGNVSQTSAGAIYNKVNTNCFFINCTISGSWAATAGGAIQSFISGAGVTTISNTIIYNNNSGISTSGNPLVINNSLVQGVTTTSNGNISGSTNPLFVNPNPYGQSTRGDYRLQTCSPVINKGNNSYYTSTITTDLDNNVRFYKNGKIDMGAYEWPGEPTVTPGGSIVYVKADGVGTGASWACATGDLQAAINEAANGDQVWVAAGTYKPIRRSDATGVITPGDRNNAFVLKNDVKVYGGFAGTENALAGRNLSLTANASILSGDLSENDNAFTNNGENAYHVVTSINNTGTTLLDGFTIQGGNADGGGGAGIVCTNSWPIFNNLIVKGNAGRYGAGFNISSSSPTITNSIITGNAGHYGGGILGSNCGAILANVLISGNTASEQGGAMYNEWAAAPVLTNVTIAGNKANYDGGAIYNNLAATLQLRNTIVYGNSSGIYNNNGTPNIQYSLVQGATSTTNGNIAGTVDPSFVNLPIAGLHTSGDYTLQTCSPAINTGNGIFFTTGQSPNLQTVTTDLKSTTRNQGITVDMGVYEYAGNPAAADLLAINEDVAAATISGSTSYIANSTSCRLITTLQPTGTTNALAGSVNARVWIESIQTTGYVKRHYDINPASNAANATGRATLYFTQAEFDAFNAVNAAKLPTAPTNVMGKTILVVKQYKGVSSDGTGVPGSYSAGFTDINPNDIDIVWNATASRWEVSIDFTGNGGFFVTTDLNILPLTLLNFNGRSYSGYNQLKWETADEVHTRHFIVERSTDGNAYSAIVTIPAGSNAYGYKDHISFDGKMYYRLKMVDKDEQFTYSSIVTLSKNGGGTVSLYPNPANDKLYISTNSELLQHSVRLYDISGQLLQTIQITNSVQTISVQQLKSGLYLLQFDNGTTVKFFKK